MNLIEILLILLIHWFSDFVFQTDEQAKGKSKEWKWLLSHTYTYSMLWYGLGAFFVLANYRYNYWNYQEWDLSKFVLITFIAHTITDYFTSRLNSRLWSQGKVHNFFVSVGFDQYLHYVQLFITYWYIFKSH